MNLSSVHDVQELDEGVFLLDLGYQGAAGVVGAYLIANAAGTDLTLVDTGPASTVAVLLERIRQTGHDPAAIRHVLLSHVHLDHAGAAGVLLPHIGPARVVVHPRGARHLIDPSKLLASATRIYGADMDRLWGRTVPVPEHSVDVVQDGAEIVASGRSMRAYHTPGHASHHLAYLDAEREAVYTGDVAGVRMRNIPYVAAPTPSPDIDLPAWKQSLDRIRRLEPKRLYLAHFGAAGDPAWHLDAVEAQLNDLETWLRGRMGAVTDPTELATELRDRVRADCARISGMRDDQLADAYELAAPSWMNLDGLRRYLRLQSTPRRDELPT